jgi:hypothetical protein
VNAAQGILPQVPGVLADPGTVPKFISNNNSVPAGQTESNFTKVGRAVDAGKAIYDLPRQERNQPPPGLDLRLRLDISADPKYGGRAMLNLQLVNF